jgi:membrane protein implicated in regulation of membrane protease activity
LVKIDNERWRARAEENIKKGEQVVVTDVHGVTLIVEKNKGGN